MKRAKTILLDSLRKNADLLVFVLVMQFWPFLTGTPVNVRTALAVGGVWLVARFIGAAQEIESRDGVAPKEKEKREFVDHPEAVLDIARLTGYEAIRRFAPYIGKWMTISGTYEGVAESLQKDAIHLSLLLKDGRRVILKYGCEHGDQLRGLREGQRITAMGRIRYSYFTFTLEDCELVRVERVRLAYAS
jgi:hypothetical protein